MGTGAIRGQPVENFWKNSSTTSYHDSNLNSDMACDNCASRFNIFKKKKICATCSKKFCRSCTVKKFTTLRNKCQYNCMKCSILECEILDYDSLMKLRVRDLQQYLQSRNIATQYCTEKRDLVNLILRFNVNNTRNNRNNPSSTSGENNSRTESSHIPDLIEENSQIEGANLTLSSPIQRQEAEDTQEDTMSQDPSPNYTLCRRASLSDLKCADDVDSLTIRQLKEILVTNYVDYRGCCEKRELIYRVRELWKSNQENILLLEANSTKINKDDALCKICMDALIDCVLLECGHLVACTKCGKRLAECPICRQFVIRVVHTFKA